MTISATSLQVRIGRRTIVHEADLRLDTGVLGLLGPNGAGKTTLIRTLATALVPAAGRLELFGHTVTGSDRELRGIRRRIGYAPQLPLVLRHLSVRDQVAYAAWLKGLDAGDNSVLDALDRVDLADRAKDKTRRLSGGMLRRLGIAMALVADPDLLLLDEPTAGLDPQQRIEFRKLVSELGEDRAVILSTHLIEDVAAVCTTLSVMTGGRTIFHGTPDELANCATAADDHHSPVEAGFIAVTGVRQA